MLLMPGIRAHLPHRAIVGIKEQHALGAQLKARVSVAETYGKEREAGASTRIARECPAWQERVATRAQHS